MNAPRSAVYRALLDAAAIAKWRVPAGMSSHVHEFDAREGGSFRISLTYDAPTGTGKSAAHTDTCRTSRWSRYSSSRQRIPDFVAR
jgi:uncharacterized protein YndB with AHSA1/START domain